MYMKIPFNDLSRQSKTIKTTLEKAVSAVIEKGVFFFGDQTKLFEEEWATLCRVPYCFGVGSGSDALEIALRSVGCNSHTEVITTTNAGGYSTMAINLTGATPVYVDVDPETLSICHDEIPKAITSKTKCVIVTHLYGIANDVLSLRQRLIESGHPEIYIIEDCAQAHGVTICGKPVGSLGDIGTFSFYPTKNLGGFGNGGAIVCKKDHLAQSIIKLKQYGWSKKYKSEICYGRNSRLDEIQAAILRIKLVNLNKNNKIRRSIVQMYKNAASSHIKFLQGSKESYNGHLCVVRALKRETFIKSLEEVGIETSIHYPILDCDQPMMKNIRFKCHQLYNTRVAAKEIVSLPCFPELTSDEIEYICHNLNQWTPGCTHE
jgi:dTDP-4-amino-4,6-dideoxygalactose transaminase